MPRHIPSLDGLRALAVLLVLWCHVPLDLPGYPEWLRMANWWIGPGGLGVELFFALSGFLITSILIAERDADIPVRWFLLRRVLRIFPIYYGLLLVMLVVQPGPGIAWCAAYLGNVANVFAPGAVPLNLEHTWSLCVEEHFYLLWPLVVAFTSNRTARRVLVFGAIPIATLGALAIGWSLPIERANLIIERLSPFRFLTLAGGALVAFAEPQLRADARRLLLRGAMLTGLGLLTLPPFGFVVLPFLWLGVAWWPIELGSTVTRVHMTLLCTGLLLLSLYPARHRLAPQQLLSLAPLRAIGRISYGLYLYHLPIFLWVLHPAAEADGIAVALAWGATFAVATGSYWLIERPILRFAARYRSAA